MKKHLIGMQSLVDNMVNQHEDINVDTSFHFLRVMGLFEYFLDAGFRKVGLNRTQIMILSFLLVNDGVMTPTEFQRITLRSINAISKSLDTLDKMGLTKSSSTKKDRRKRKVTLTKTGLDLIEKIVIVRHNLFSQAVNCLNKEQAEDLKVLLIQLENHLVNIMGINFNAKHKDLIF